MHRQRTILFIDEIHRFNKVQQDAVLPHIENGTVILIGATTENPSFEIIPPLLSRCKVVTLQALSKTHLKKIIATALEDDVRGLGQTTLSIHPTAIDLLCENAHGDARWVLNSLDMLFNKTKLPNIAPSHIAPFFQLSEYAYPKFINGSGDKNI